MPCLMLPLGAQDPDYEGAASDASSSSSSSSSSSNNTGSNKDTRQPVEGTLCCRRTSLSHWRLLPLEDG